MVEARTPIWKRRWFLLTAGIVVLLVVAVAFVLPMLLDVERYRPYIEQALRDQTGWEPELGAIDLSIFPKTAVRVEASRLDSPDSASSIAIGSLDVAASLWPLLRGTLDIQDVTLDRPQLTLVREAGDDAWDLPLPPQLGTADPEREPGKPAIDVAVRRVRLRGGSVRIEDRSVDPPRTIAVEPFAVTVLPEEGSVDGSAALAPDGGSLRWEGTFADGLRLTLENLATGRLAAIVGSDLLQPGGTLSGTVDVGVPFAVDAKLNGRRLGLVTGERPIESADLSFRVVSDATGLLLESTNLALGELRMAGSGRLTPSLELALGIPAAPLESTLEAVRGVMHFPLDVAGPGTASADVDIWQDDDAILRYKATGALSAARLVVADFLPPGEDVKTTFDLSAAGKLTVHIADGKVAGGPMRGKIELPQVDPPAELRFTGSLRGASAGGLLAGFVEDAAEKIVGPTSVQADLSVDLTREVLDANAVGGALTLSSGQITLPGWDVEGKVGSELAARLTSLNLTSLVDQKKVTQLGTSDVPVAFDGMRADLKMDTIPWALDGLKLTRDNGSLSGGGTFNPLKGTIAIDVDVELSPRRSAKLVEQYSSLKVLVDDDGRIRLPLGLVGAIDQPGLEVDLGSLALEALGGDETKKKLFDKVKRLFDDDDD